MGRFQWIFKCQMGRLLLYIQWILKCQMRRLLLLGVKSGDYYYMSNGEIIIICQLGRLLLYANWGRLKLLCQLGRYPDHGLFAFHSSASTLSLVFVLIVPFSVMNILN